MSTITAIIPTYNRSSLLRECIGSVLAQTRPLDEIIVVDDGSTDDTQAVMGSYGDRVKLLTKPNGGKASALNLALAQCTGDYVWICDDDDYAAPDGLTHLAAALDDDASAGFAFGTFRIFTGEGRARVFSPPTYWRREEEPNPALNFLEEMFTFQFAMLVRRSLYQKVGTFREDLIRSQDYDMAIRLSQAAKGEYVPEVIFFQRRHEGQRGPSGKSFAAEGSIRKWLEYDQKIFAGVRSTIPLQRFTPTFALGWDGARAERAAYLERACVLAQRAMWDDAITDLGHAGNIGETPASPEEIRLAEAVIRNALAWDVLAGRKDWIRALHECGSKSAYGRDILYAACRPLVWQSRSSLIRGDAGGGIRKLKLLAAILGPRGAYRRALASLKG